MTTGAHAIVALCRAGFEPECAQDLRALADAADAPRPAELVIQPGVVVLPLSRPLTPARMTDGLSRRPPVFAREVCLGTGPHPLGERDRITPIVDVARQIGVKCGSLWLEFPDTNDGKQLSSMCRRLEPLLRGFMSFSRRSSKPMSRPARPAGIPRGRWAFRGSRCRVTCRPAPR
jgi:23S rRNA (cytidine2498-2'-O)-methyltransferase